MAVSYPYFADVSPGKAMQYTDNMMLALYSARVLPGLDEYYMEYLMKKRSEG